MNPIKTVAIAPTNRWAAWFFLSILKMNKNIDTVTTWQNLKELPAYWHEPYYTELKNADFRLFIGKESIESPSRPIRSILIGENAHMKIHYPEITQVDDWSGLLKVLDEDVSHPRGNPGT